MDSVDNEIKKRLEISIQFYNSLIQQSHKNQDPQIYISFLQGQATAYEKILKEIYKKEIESKGI